jgi:hypothetical protein
MPPKQQVLLLNSNYETLHFIAEERHIIKLIYKNKVEIVSSWPDKEFIYGKDPIPFPAILKLRKEIIKNRKFTFVFSHMAVFLRDQYICQYCNIKLDSKIATIDHVLPKSLSGKSSFENCVTACKKCNFKKSNKTLEQANMKLLNEPSKPSKFIYYFHDKEFVERENWHPDWFIYIKI